MREARFDPVESDRKQVSRFSLWSSIILMAAILAVAGIVSALTAMRFAIRGREVAVPPLAGKTADEAKEIVSHNGLLLKVSTSRISSKVPEGHILDQIPPSGSRLKINRTVNVLLSLGERRFPVPNLVGTSLRAAQLTLSQRKLALGRRCTLTLPKANPPRLFIRRRSPEHKRVAIRRSTFLFRSGHQPSISSCPI